MNHEDKGIMCIRLSKALEKEANCFLCHLEGKLEQRFIETYLSELVMDSKAREKIIESRGFCNYHSYKMLVSAITPASEDSLGMALILKDISEQLIEDVKNQQNIKFALTKKWNLNLKRSAGSIHDTKLFESVSNEIKCPTCDHISKVMKLYIEGFLSEITQDEKMWKLYDKSKVMCMSHYVMTLYIATSISNGRFEPVIKKLIEKQIQVLERLQKDLSGYIEKQIIDFQTEKGQELRNLSEEV